MEETVKEWTTKEFIELHSTLKELSLSQKRTTENINELTKTMQQFQKSLENITELTYIVNTHNERITKLEETKKDMVSFIVKSIASMVIAGSIYAFYVMKGK